MSSARSAGLPAVSENEPVAIRQGQGKAVAGAALCVRCVRHDFPADAAIAAVIRRGSVIGKAPIVSMPHWGGVIPQADVDALIAYPKTLK